jgi:energy-coupling factor transporter ATP-binding protein EcfA2
MTLEKDLAAWVVERTDWQRDAIARFCRNEVLSDVDVARIVDHLVAGTYPSAVAISASDIPGASDTGDPVRLIAVEHIEGVNALLPAQRLTFGDTGLTIIYGDNASGKSGYARLLCQAVTARVKAEVLGDVFATREGDAKASFEYAVGEARATWSFGDEQSRALSSVRFFDEQCGNAYVTVASEISYRPSALMLLDRLSSACEQVQLALAVRLADNAATRPDLPMLADGTTARRFVDGLTASTTQAQIDEAARLAPEHDVVLAERLNELARLQVSDPTAEKERLTRIGALWATVKSHVVELEKRTSSQVLTQVYELKQRSATLRQAATLASQEGFDTEPLGGVGTETWRALWEAARQYSLSEAYHEHEFPVVDDDALCVLCQQPLAQEGAERLQRFEGFVSDTTSRGAAAAENEIKSRRDEFAALFPPPSAVTSAISFLLAAGEDVSPTQSWLASAESAAVEVVAWLDGLRDDVPTAPVSAPSAWIESRRKSLIDASEAIDDATFTQALSDLSAEVAELQAMSHLAAARQNLGREVERLKSRVRIEEARRLADTTGITRKATSLTTEYVTSVVRDQFTRETERLHLRKVSLDPTSGRRSVTLQHRPRLLGAPSGVAINGVLSEGEQTALGLAGFLTEVEFDSSGSAVVLDDPVSSLDAGRRSRVARRLVDLAQSRQVIVFTHDATFVNGLNKAARDLEVEVTERSIMRRGERPGLVADTHPWSVKDIPARIHELESDLVSLKRDRGELDSDAYTRRAQEWGGHLSQAWERAVNMEIVNELVDRGTNEVRPRMFKMLVGISEQDNNDYQSGYAKVSEWAVRHDQAPETNFVAPEPDELAAELVRFRDWVKRIKAYKK